MSATPLEYHPAMSGIAPTIRSSHTRIAEHYGICPPEQQHPPFNTYEHWNYERTVVFPVRLLTAKFRLEGEGLLLDAGCGNGQYLDLYARFTERRLLGVDFSPTMLEHARNRAERRGYADRLSLVQGNVYDLSFLPEASVDVVHCFGVFDHLDQPARALEQFRRIIKPDGVVILGYPRRWSLAHLSFLLAGQSPEHWGEAFSWKQMLDLPSKCQFYRFYSRRGIEALIAQAGLVVEDRLPVAPAYVTGFPGKPLHSLARRGGTGYRWLNRIDRLAWRMGLPPAGEYLVLRPRASS